MDLKSYQFITEIQTAITLHFINQGCNSNYEEKALNILSEAFDTLDFIPYYLSAHNAAREFTHWALYCNEDLGLKPEWISKHPEQEIPHNSKRKNVA